MGYLYKTLAYTLKKSWHSAAVGACLVGSTPGSDAKKVFSIILFFLRIYIVRMKT